MVKSRERRHLMLKKVCRQNRIQQAFMDIDLIFDMKPIHWKIQQIEIMKLVDLLFVLIVLQRIEAISENGEISPYPNHFDSNKNYLLTETICKSEVRIYSDKQSD